ncbi:MAG: ROK family protein [Paracoccaceae bacterium]
MTLAILADIGGTNTRVALADGRVVRQGSIRRYSNAEYKARGQDISAILRDYLGSTGAQVSGVCVAAAGPVQDGVATLTNLDWTMDAGTLRAATGASRVAILNDLQAQGHALGHIAADRLRPLISGPSQPGAAMLVVGLGTGVNAAPVHGAGAGRIVPPSECGHVNMAVRSADDLALMQFVQDLLTSRHETPHCSVEEVLSGRGLANLHAFAAHQTGCPASLTSAQVLQALDAGDPTATEAARSYTRILAQTLADLALIHLPYGGIFLIGGMARAMTPHFAGFGLTETFREPRRVDLLEKDFAVWVVEDDFAALTGCAAWLQAQTG